MYSEVLHIKAIEEAKRFIELSEIAIKSGTYSKEMGSCKRASMDLTRALSEFRR